MASSITINSDSFEGRYIQLYCTQTKDLANNRSKVTWTLSSIGGEVGTYTIGETTVVINGVTVYHIPKTDYATRTFPATVGAVSGELWINHENDGNKTISVSLATRVYVWQPITYPTTWYMDKIDRYATISSAPNFYDTQNPTVNYTNMAGNNVSSLQMCISTDGTNIQAGYRDVSKTSSTYTFNLSEAERNALRSLTSGSSRTVYFYIKTVIGSNTFYDRKAATLYIGSSSATKPTVSVTYSLINREAFSGLLVYGRTKLTVNVSANAKTGASISSISTKIDGTSYSGTSFTSNAVKYATSFTTVVTDSRGITTEVVTNLPDGQYHYAPYITPIKNENGEWAYRCNSDGTKNNSGTHVRVGVKCSHSPIYKDGVDANYIVNLLCRYMETPEDGIIEEDDWSEWQTLSLDGNESFNGVISGTFDVEKTYIVELNIGDCFKSEYSIRNEIPNELITFHFAKGGRGLGIGRYSDSSKDKSVTVGWDAFFDKAINGTLGGNDLSKTTDNNLDTFALSRPDGITFVETGKYTSGTPNDTGFQSSSGMIVKGGGVLVILLFGIWSDSGGNQNIAEKRYIGNNQWTSWRYI